MNTSGIPLPAAPAGFIPVVCPLCGEPNQRKSFGARDNNWGYEGVFTYGFCVACGILFENPRPDETVLPRYYPPAYGGLPHDVDPVVEAKIEKGVIPLRARAITRHRAAGSVFDVGCGAGFFLAYMRRRGWRVAGIDASADHVLFAREKLGMDKVVLGTWPPPSSTPESYDAVTMFHVLEHLTDPLRSLAAAYERLLPGGTLIIETPNSESWPARMFGNNWVTLDAPRHVVIFSKSTLRQALERTGFSMVHIGTWSPSTMEYSESLRYAIRERCGRPSAHSGEKDRRMDPAIPRSRPPFGALRDGVHQMEKLLYSVINRCSDLAGAGCNLFAIAQK